MYAKTTRIVNNTGLHARPASDFVSMAKKYSAKITITNLDEYPDEPASAKSIIDVLSLSMTQGTSVQLSASGEDEVDAVESLAALIDSGFGEL
jgi:phosphocarrier protein HPr